jgi:hypothetical protein
MRKGTKYKIIDAIIDLQVRGFILDFSLIRNKLFCVQEKCYLVPDEVNVIEVHSFITGKFNRNKAIIVCAIESLYRPLKGILLSSGCHLNARSRVLRPKHNKLTIYRLSRDTVPITPSSNHLYDN